MATFVEEPRVSPGGAERGEAFSIAQFLEAEQRKDLLRLSTAGSVDDGKSTLIGRLLYDSRNVYEDHVRSVTRTLGGSAKASIDFAQLTDGLRAEREQGITIDVAYRYFSTERRNFIIADTPGHEQYTRNMATGASTAQLAVILVDATKGLVTQSRRHIYITSLLGIRQLVAAINKMDLVGFSPEVFARIEQQFRELVAQLGDAEVAAIPVSALDGDNVVEPSTRTPWYQGPTLLEHLEAVPARQEDGGAGFRLPVQRVIRPRPDYPQPNFRGFAGQIASGTVGVGDLVVALPSGRTSRVASISTFDGDLQRAHSPQSVALTLEDELDISRGDFLAAASHPPQTGSSLEASLVWFDGQPLDLTRNYLLKHAAQTVGARVVAIRHRVNMQSLERESASSLAMNDVGQVEIETLRPIFFDPYRENRISGSFILIDAETNATAAAGMIEGAGAGQGSAAAGNAAVHAPAVILIDGPALAAELESVLLQAGCAVVRTRRHDPVLWRGLLGLGIITLVEAESPSGTGNEGARLAVFSTNDPGGGALPASSSTPEGGPEFSPRLVPLSVTGGAHSGSAVAAHAREIARLLRQRGILRAESAGAEA